MTGDRESIAFGGEAAVRLRELAAIFETDPPETVRRALLLYEVWAGLKPNESLAVVNNDTGQVDRLAFQWSDPL